LGGPSAEFAGTGSVREFSVVTGAGDEGSGVAGDGSAAAEVADTDFAGADCDTGDGAEEEGGRGAGGFADADSSKDCDAGFGFRARFSEEFNQKEILAVPSGFRTVCRCNGHCPR
jgi:hypothetical protein